MSTMEELLEFPCEYIFKAFGLNEESFSREVREAVSRVIPVPLDAVKKRSSREGTYQSVSIFVRLHNIDQLRAIYAELRKVEGLRYLL